jgi:hypothetical protein
MRIYRLGFALLTIVAIGTIGGLRRRAVEPAV